MCSSYLLKFYFKLQEQWFEFISVIKSDSRSLRVCNNFFLVPSNLHTRNCFMRNTLHHTTVLLNALHPIDDYFARKEPPVAFHSQLTKRHRQWRACTLLFINVSGPEMCICFKRVNDHFMYLWWCFFYRAHTHIWPGLVSYRTRRRARSWQSGDGWIHGYVIFVSKW